LEFSDDERFLRYEGQVKDGKPWGLGNMSFSDGGVYSGNWKAGRRNAATAFKRIRQTLKKKVTMDRGRTMLNMAVEF
jgi:hypothetical protein